MVDIASITEVPKNLRNLLKAFAQLNVYMYSASLDPTYVTHFWLADGNNNNKSAQSNLGRGPHRGVVAHVRRKVPIGYNAAHQSGPPKVPMPMDRSPNPIYLPHPCTRPTYDAERHPDLIHRFPEGQTARQIIRGKVQ